MAKEKLAEGVVEHQQACQQPDCIGKHSWQGDKTQLVVNAMYFQFAFLKSRVCVMVQTQHKPFFITPDVCDCV